jgi:hypothetical protein
METQTAITAQSARRLVASFPTYDQAQRAVDYLADEKFPVERVAIVGEGLRLVEQITGRRTWGKTILNGLLGGGFIGLVLGWLLGWFSLVNPLISAMSMALWGFVLGAVSGVFAGVFSYAAIGGRRDFTSVGTMQATQYNVLVDADVADAAQRLLARLPVE